MKKFKIIFLTPLVLLISLSSFAQTEKVKDYKWGFGVAINSVDAQIGTPLKSSWGSTINNLDDNGSKRENSYSLSITPKYFMKNDIALRFEFGITNIQIRNNKNIYGSGEPYVFNQSIKQSIFRINPGMQWSFIKKKHIELFCGATLCYNKYSSVNYYSYAEYRQEANNMILQWFNSSITFPGGYSAGIGALTGFNIYLQKHISLGAEFSTSFLYNKIGGENTEIGTTYNYLANPTVTEYSNTSFNLYEGIQFSKILSSFNISVWF